MTNKEWEDTFIEATTSLLDALSYVDEFDGQTFMASYFGSSPVDSGSRAAGHQALHFLNHTNSLIKILRGFRPNPNDKNSNRIIWSSAASYQKALRTLDLLQKTVVVIPKLQKTAETIPGISFTAARRGLNSFRKQCETAILDLNNIIEFYGRYSAPEYPLPKIILPS
jgi:hypothetical protein